MKNLELIIRYSIIKTLFLTLATLAFILTSFWFVFSDIEPGKSIFLRTQGIILAAKIIFGFGVVFFTTALYFVVQRLIDNKPLLVANEKGIYDYTSSSSFGFIPWSDVKDISVASLGGVLNGFSVGYKSNTFIRVDVIKNEEYLAKTNQFIASLLKVDIKANTCIMNISLQVGERRNEKIVKEMRTIFEAYKANNFSTPNIPNAGAT